LRAWGARRRYFGHGLSARIGLSVYSLATKTKTGGGLGGVVGEFVAFFDGDVASPVGDFDVTLEMVDVGYWRGKLEMDINLFRGDGRGGFIIWSVGKNGT
jgi:hypothetical protein